MFIGLSYAINVLTIINILASDKPKIYWKNIQNYKEGLNVIIQLEAGHMQLTCV